MTAPRRQRSIVAMLVLAHAWLAAAQPSVQSLAPNPSFEKGQGEQPAEWRFYSWQGAEGWWASEHSHRGRRS